MINFVYVGGFTVPIFTFLIGSDREEASGACCLAKW